MNVTLVKDIIKYRGLTYEQAARLCGISKVTLCNILAGADVKVSTLRAIAKGLGVQASALLLAD